MHKKSQASGYYHCETSIRVGLNSTPHPSSFLVESSDVANTLEPPPEKLAKQVQLEKPIKSEDFKGEDMVCRFHLTQLSAIEPPSQDGSTQSPWRSLSTCDAFTQVDHLFNGIPQVQKEGFDKIHDDLVDIRTTIRSSLESTQAGMQNGLDRLQSAVQKEAGKSSAYSGLPAIETEMRELKCIVQSEIKRVERSIKSSFDILNSNIAALNQNIVELGNVLTLIHACNSSGAMSQDV
ncbi:uncharacterized protein LOC134349724 [Mobula hypostoma]|uniref:uncharacterized protein LOC134349724 n=1 Tax=Mobula hypostoma TaxID=723540 RepID=UPI002FC34C3D